MGIEDASIAARVADTVGSKRPALRVVAATAFVLAALVAIWAPLGPSAAALLVLAFATVTAAALAFSVWLAERRIRVLKEQEAERSEAMSRCGSTGALMRSVFLEACEKRIRHSLPGTPLAYFAVDMDHLKTINDSLGHDIGDAALRHLVNTMRNSMKTGTIIGRLGGDEFAFLVSCAGRTEAEEIAARFRAALDRPAIIKGRELTLSATVGMVLLPEHTSFLSEALQFSDLALYAGKNDGRNRSTGFEIAMLCDLRQTQQIDRELKLALARDELRQRYLPVVDADGRIRSARAVADWNSRWLGEIPAATFLAVAEKSDLIDRFGEWSFRRACLDAALFEGDLGVSVAISGYQLKRDTVIDMVSRALGGSGIEPRRVVAVIGRTTTSAANAGVERRLQSLRALGIRISLDDIGAFLSDDERLQRFPVDVVRIPAAQIARLGQSERDNAAVSALAGIARAMDLRIVAEGVQTQQQLMLARAAGCDRFAGPFFGASSDVAGINERIEESSTPAALAAINASAAEAGVVRRH